MSRVKRRRSEDFLLANVPADLLIITSDSETPIEAHFIVLLPCSKLVRDLPRASSGQTIWDLSKLVLEGHSSPVASAVVRQWLSHLYSRIDVAQTTPMFPSLSEAAQSLLLFADAVGTSTAVLRSICAALTSQPGLTLPVVVNGGAGGTVVAAAAGGAAGGGGADAAPPPPLPPLQLELLLRGKLYYVMNEGLRSLDVPYASAFQTIIAASGFEPYDAALPGAVAAALEGWLYLAGRLGLVALVRLLLDFFQSHLLPGHASVILDSTKAVLSRRVLECMPHELLVEGFVSDRLWGPQLGQADVATGSQLKLVMHSEHAATWFGVGPGTQLTGDVVQHQNTLTHDRILNVLRLSVGGLDPAEHQQAVQEVLQQLEEEGAGSTAGGSK